MQFKFLKTRKKKKKKEKINVIWYLDTLITLQLNGLYIFCFSMHKSICSQRKIYGLLRSLCDRRISSTSVRYFPNCLEVVGKLSTCVFICIIDRVFMNIYLTHCDEVERYLDKVIWSKPNPNALIWRKVKL